MGSGEFLVMDEHLHVFRDSHERWWAVGKEGSYGGDTRRARAIWTALDASATGFHGKRPIVVHYVGGAVAYTILKTRRSPSSQFFQDAVP